MVSKQNRKNHKIELIDADKDNSILDLDCDGTLAKALQDKGLVTGVDAPKELLNIAKENILIRLARTIKIKFS